MQDKIKVAILGANGYTGMQLVSLLFKHPKVEISHICSRQYEGTKLSDYNHCYHFSSLVFEKININLLVDNCDVIFLALPHGISQEYISQFYDKDIKIVDLSADFRLNNSEVFSEFYGAVHKRPELLTKFTYGLVEQYQTKIANSSHIASPGCYPTSILLPLLPLLKNNLVSTEGIVINSMSGVSGAGKALKEDFLYVERNESVCAYNSTKHRHLAEIEQEISLVLDDEKRPKVDFIPHLVPMSIGMHTTISVRLKGDMNEEKIISLLKSTYADSAFVHIFDDYVDTKDVVGTNSCFIYPMYNPRTNSIIIHSVIDNLIKGAGGQAIQAMNVMLGLEESLGVIIDYGKRYFWIN